MAMIIGTQINNDFEKLGNLGNKLIEVFDKRVSNTKDKPPMKYLGRMPIRDILLKFH